MKKSIIRTEPNAKINLSLEVLFKRDDGFHELNTIFAPINLTDKISFCFNDSATSELRIAGKTQDLSEQDNIIIQAVNLFNQAFGIESKGLDIELEKNIPIGAGLGGGSADAAFTLLALRELHGLPNEMDYLYPIAEELGSDVPFFLMNSSAIGTGRGEKLKPVQFDLPYHILLVNPKIHISTAFAYENLKLRNEIIPINYQDLIKSRSKDISKWRDTFINDFESSVFESYPEIKSIKENLYTQGAFFALMSGSGSTTFGIFETQEQVQVAEKFFRDNHPDYLVFSTNFL
jgi:4-diphosphocytidyl-2-C-methyl-D-erythritol kinase